VSQDSETLEFPLFLDLPPEIRAILLEMSLPAGQHVFIRVKDESKDKKLKAIYDMPASLQTNRESLKLAKRFYQPI
jgi:hypothetical protein